MEKKSKEFNPITLKKMGQESIIIINFFVTQEYTSMQTIIKFLFSAIQVWNAPKLSPFLKILINPNFR